MEKCKFDIGGMTCAACAAHVEKAAKSVPGVTDARVNLMLATLETDGKADAGQIISAVERAGYRASPFGAQKKADASVAMKKRLIWSLIFWAPLMYIAMGHMLGAPLPAFLSGNGALYAGVQLLFTLPILWFNRAYFTRGFSLLLRGGPNMDSLIAVGTAASVAYSLYAFIRLCMGDHSMHMSLYFESAGTILTLITLGKYLETRSRGKTSRAIERLIRLSPDTAVVLRNGVESEVPLGEVQPGDIVVVRPGGRVPVDGSVSEGASFVNEAALTGESMPREVASGSRVMAASINGQGILHIRAEQVGRDTTLSRIITLVEEASSTKAPIARLADKVSGVFVPVVMGIAAFTVIVWLLVGQGFAFALTMGVSVLVISCPCALGLATPVAIMAGTGKGAEHGILYKSAEALEIMHRAQVIVLDKTGTLTKGAPSVTDVLCADGISESELLITAAALEKSSEHPLASAVISRAGDIKTPDVAGFTALPGRGIAGEIGGVPCRAGNVQLMQENGIDASAMESAAQRLATDGKTALYIARGQALLGIIAVADVLKDTSREAVSRMHAMHKKTVMLTGDARRTAEAVARQAGIDQVIADVLPQDKERAVRELMEQGQRVVMIGDGINDAPALTRADVGVALGAGTDIAIDAADVVLMRDDLRDAATAMELSDSVLRNIRMNLFWAFFYNVIGIPIAAGVLYPAFGLRLDPMLAAAAMSLSSVCVVTNALRLRFFKPTHAAAQAETRRVLLIEGMMCAHCEKAVSDALSALPGVLSARADAKAGEAHLTLRGRVEDEALIAAVRAAGYEPKGFKED